MTKAAKIVISIVVSLMLLGFTAIALGVYWWSHHSQELFDAVEKEYKEGQDTGKKTDEQGCVDEAVARYKKNRGFTQGISAGLFLRGCLETSRPTPDFCEQVPRRTEILKSARWQIDQSRKAGISESDAFGRQIFSQIQDYCESDHTKPTPAQPEKPNPDKVKPEKPSRPDSPTSK